MRVPSVVKSTLIDKSNNTVNIIHPYRTKFGTWVYDDPELNVYMEAFVMGSSEVIDHLVGKDTNYFDAAISSHPLPNPTAVLTRMDNKNRESGMNGWYHLEGTNMDHWLCGCVLDYFSDYPEKIYVVISNKKTDPINETKTFYQFYEGE